MNRACFHSQVSYPRWDQTIHSFKVLLKFLSLSFAKTVIVLQIRAVNLSEPQKFSPHAFSTEVFLQLKRKGNILLQEVYKTGPYPRHPKAKFGVFFFFSFPDSLP